MTNERRIADLERTVADSRTEIAVLKSEVATLRRETADNRDENKTTRAWLVGFCISLALAAVGMAVTLSQIIPGGGN